MIPFKAILFYPPIANDSTALVDLFSAAFFAVLLSTTSSFLIFAIQYAQAVKVEKKKTLAIVLAQKIGQTVKKNGIKKRKKTPILFPVLIKLIRAKSKQKMRVTSIAAKIIPSYYIRKIKTGNKKINDEINN